MGLYARHIFPRLMDWSLRGEQHARYRRRALAGATGRVLEVGFGTGLNLEYYPNEVHSVTAVDTRRMLPRTVEQRVGAAAMSVRLLQADATNGLPFETNRFDTVVTTWTLCSLDPVRPALAELRRVLRRSGRLLFLEHGRSDRRRVARLQDFLNPVQNLVGCGCNLNRAIDALLKEAGFEIDSMERFKMPSAPRVVGEVYRGVARIDGRA